MVVGSRSKESFVKIGESRGDSTVDLSRLHYEVESQYSELSRTKVQGQVEGHQTRTGAECVGCPFVSTAIVFESCVGESRK